MGAFYEFNEKVLTMIEIKRTNILLKPDSSRVFFRPLEFVNRERVIRVMARVMSLSEDQVDKESAKVMERFGNRHHKLEAFFIKRYETVKDMMILDSSMSRAKQLLIGSYFCQEYSLEAAALFNPSIVPDPDQSGLPEGAMRFIMSLRATGEGHISSLVFRSGIVHGEGRVELMETSRYATAPEEAPDPEYCKGLFERKLHELGLLDTFVQNMMQSLPAQFTFQELKKTVDLTLKKNRLMHLEQQNVLQSVTALARANYLIRFSPGQKISERLIFPSSPSESNGIEDARFVTFREDDGQITYYATYTAYDGKVTFPQLIETKDFLTFKLSTLNGSEVQNKGMALFPRKINGHYAMISRQDGENIFLMYSDMLHFWHDKKILMRPTYPWEFLQLGNCGSPIETKDGWLLLTHGVGAMRQYSIGCILLDLDNPGEIICRLPYPLITPDQTEREGYVPNVVYTCGYMEHAGHLVIPYGMSDSCVGFATVEMEDLLSELKKYPVKGK